MDRKQVFEMWRRENLIPRDYKYTDDLTWTDIEDLVTDRPSVSYDEWIRIRTMPVDELEREFLALKYLVLDCTVDDMKFYATRFWLPKCGDIDELVARWQSYDDIGINARNLLAKWYPPTIGTLEDDPYVWRKSFTLAYPHPLEPLILALDDVDGVKTAVQALSYRYGFGDLDPYDSTVDLYDRIEQYIDVMPNHELAYHPAYRYVSFQELINYNEREYMGYVKQYLSSSNKLVHAERVYYQLFLEYKSNI